MAAPLPIAAGLDWIEALLPFLFLLFWIVSQIRNLFRGVGGAKPQGPVVVRPVPKPVAPDAAHEELARQIEEFLRRSQGGKPAAPPPMPRREAPVPPRRRGVEARRDAGSPALPGERLPARPVRAESVARPAPKSAAESARPLGSLGGHATDVARHVEGAFARDLDHQAASLARSSTGAAIATQTATPAADLVTLLRNPATLRQLVIVREVLDRPVDRW